MSTVAGSGPQNRSQLARHPFTAATAGANSYATIGKSRGYRTDSHGKSLAEDAVMSKRLVYVLRNADNPPRYYTGLTSDVATRLMPHNAGSCIHTASEVESNPGR